MSTKYSPEHARKVAQAIGARMKAIGVQMTAAQAYEALAAAEGFRNWATMKATFETVPADPAVSVGERFKDWVANQPDDRAGGVLRGAAAGNEADMAELCGDLGLVPLYLFNARRVADGFNQRDGEKFERIYGEAEFMDVPKTVAMIQAYVRGAQPAEFYEDYLQGFMEEVLAGKHDGVVDWLDAARAEQVPALR